MGARKDLTGDDAPEIGASYVRLWQLRDTELQQFVDLTRYQGGNGFLRGSVRQQQIQTSTELIALTNTPVGGHADADANTLVDVEGNPVDGVVRMQISAADLAQLQNASTGDLTAPLFYMIEGVSNDGFEERLLEGSVQPSKDTIFQNE